MNNTHKPYGPYERYFKRPIGFFVAIFAMIMLSPLLLVLCITGTIAMHGNPIFVQKRIGKGEKEFKLYKFRSMTNAKDKNGWLLPDSERLTWYGRLLRKTSFDELGELINIIKGDMSFVGPRPLPSNYLPWYKENERIRHAVRGGLTGLAQIHGRNISDWETRFAYDAEYVNKITFYGDIRIILHTILLVLKRKDIGIRGVDGPMDFHVYRSGLSEQELNQMERNGRKYEAKKAFNA